ncbi:hypothetical protein ABMA46_05165 [Mesorhizobium sp. CN5-321]|jgi:hypothetical protein|uniref:hypothetical protein n=1 Tax=Mesorhizobium hunchu TaxID=3157708 RepID=UPI0032B73AD3
MKKRARFSAIGNFLSVFDSAVSVSAAVEAGRRPKASDLHTLGIAPTAFDNMRLR